MLNKVPEITLYFWLIKVLCTTVGETFADNLNENLGLGLSGTSYIIGPLLIGVLVFQFRAKRYVPGIYWLAVVLISVVGTLVSDNLVDNYGVTLETTTILFSAILIAVFASWYAVERTLSVHTPSSPPGGRRSTGWRSSSPSPSAPPPGTSSPSSSNSATWRRSASSPGRSSWSPSCTSACG
jgi:uncharacterized membrane-anchored protein